MSECKGPATLSTGKCSKSVTLWSHGNAIFAYSVKGRHSHTRVRQTLQMSGFPVPNCFLVLTHSACPYKNCGLEWSQLSQTLHYVLYFVCTVSPEIVAVIKFGGLDPKQRFSHYSGLEFVSMVRYRHTYMHAEKIWRILILRFKGIPPKPTYLISRMRNQVISRICAIYNIVPYIRKYWRPLIGGFAPNDVFHMHTICGLQHGTVSINVHVRGKDLADFNLVVERHSEKPARHIT